MAISDNVKLTSIKSLFFHQSNSFIVMIFRLCVLGESAKDQIQGLKLVGNYLIDVTKS